jgi:choline transport protein
MLLVQGLMNDYTFWLIPWIELFAGIGHVALFFVFIIVLVVMGPRHNAHDIFIQQDISSGWSNTFISWNLGMLTCAWSFTGFDGAIHMSEEVRKAKQAVPRAIFWTIALNGVLAYAMVIVILTVMGPIDDVLSSDYPNFPIIVIILEATGSKQGTTALVVGLFVISFAVCLASIASVSRLTWAWSRDGGLPKYFSVVRCVLNTFSPLKRITNVTFLINRLAPSIMYLFGRFGWLLW